MHFFGWKTKSQWEVDFEFHEKKKIRPKHVELRKMVLSKYTGFEQYQKWKLIKFWAFSIKEVKSHASVKFSKIIQSWRDKQIWMALVREQIWLVGTTYKMWKDVKQSQRHIWFGNKCSQKNVFYFFSNYFLSIVFSAIIDRE